MVDRRPTYTNLVQIQSRWAAKNKRLWSRATVSCNRLVQPSLATVSCNRLVQSSRATVPCNRLVQPSRATVSCNRLVQPSRATVSCNRLVQPSRATVSCNRLVQPSRATVKSQNMFHLFSWHSIQMQRNEALIVENWNSVGVIFYPNGSRMLQINSKYFK